MSIVTNDENSKVLAHCHVAYGKTAVYCLLFIV